MDILFISIIIYYYLIKQIIKFIHKNFENVG